MLNQKKLEALASVLTPKERAVLQLRAWCAGEKADYRISTFCPPQDRAEFERIGQAVEHGNSEIHGHLVILLEWLAVTESEMNWLRIFDLLAGQVKEMEKATGKRAPKVAPPWNTTRQVPIGWGILLDPVRPTGKDWAEFREGSWREVKRGLELRWADLAVFRAVLDEVEKVFGEPLVLNAVAERLAWFEESLIRLSSEFADELDVGPPNAERLAGFRQAFGLDELGDKNDARTQMHETVRASLEAFEREQAELLRNGS